MPYLLVPFRYDVPDEQFLADNDNEDIAGAVAAVPGLEWKLWLHNSERRECVGVYCFTDDAAIDAYLGGEFFTRFKSAPGYRDIAPVKYAHLETSTLVTGAPGRTLPVG